MRQLSPPFRRFLIRLYPRAWRQRYGQEFALLLDATAMTPRVVANVFGAAAREWLFRTPIGAWVLGPVVAWGANVVASYLHYAFPLEPYIVYAGLRWAPWPTYFALAMPMMVFAAYFRYHAVGKRGAIPVSVSELLRWVAAFLAANSITQWSNMVLRPELSRYEAWKSQVAMVMVSFLLLLTASKRPVETQANRRVGNNP